MREISTEEFRKLSADKKAQTLSHEFHNFDKKTKLLIFMPLIFKYLYISSIQVNLSHSSTCIVFQAGSNFSM